MLSRIKETNSIKIIRKSAFYSRIRQYFPMLDMEIVDDRDRMENAAEITIDWPKSLKKPIFGIVQDFGDHPRWTKYIRFLDNNSFKYNIYDIHAQDWIENSEPFDIIIGLPSSALFHLIEMRRKYFFLEKYLKKTTYPDKDHIFLYEDKILEAYITNVYNIPFANSYISHSKNDALQLIENLNYPVVCKINPSSGSMGTELIHSLKHSKKIVEQAFSRLGRKTHMVYFRQKDYVYFQDFIPNDGYDIRAIVIGNRIFGYYRRVLDGDFRASGMNLVEKRSLPDEPVRIARNINRIIKSPMLVVDMLHSTDDKYYVIEFSPFCQIETPEQLHVDSIPGVYIFDDDDNFHFEEGRYWVHELALREFLLRDYLPMML